MLNKEQKKILLSLARESIVSRLESREIDVVESLDNVFKEKRGLFVTLERNGDLRGCIGYVRGYKSVWSSVIEMAQAAAFNDRRFRPVSKKEIEQVNIEISLLSELIPVSPAELDQIKVGRDGLYIEGMYGSGLLLPQVAVDWGWDRSTFLREVCLKAGLGGSCYLVSSNQLYRFSAEILSDLEEN
ncbi:MAG: AmmeMemoRadiSam system protein A [Candidatus Cloacimonas sp.]|nr:AmmeMemoRadiSam system protein A [Candidatus Cloacimonadota bacterium]